MEEPEVVYVVDADYETCRTVAEMLKSAGLAPRPFHSGGAFLANGRLHCFGCVVLELALPDMSGLEVQTRLSAVGSPLQVIFLSDQATVPDAVQAIKAGALDFIRKPPNKGQLLSLIEDALAHSHVH